MQNPRSTLDWDDLRYVLAVSRDGTVSGAAKRLGVDHATVIRRIDRLERGLNAKLFVRRKTGYERTAAGARIAAAAEAVESAVIAGRADISGTAAHVAGTVRIGAPDGFGSVYLAARLGGLVDRHPELDVQLVATARLFSLSKREADVAISVGLPQEGRIVGRKLVDYRLGLYAAPSYLAEHPPIASRADLARHRFVGYIEELLFTDELDYLPQVSPAITPRIRSANLIAQLHATLAGVGIAVLPAFLVAEVPGLVPVLPAEVSIQRAFWLLMHADSRTLAHFRTVAEYIHEIVERDRALFQPVA